MNDDAFSQRLTAHTPNRQPVKIAGTDYQDVRRQGYPQQADIDGRGLLSPGLIASHDHQEIRIAIGTFFATGVGAEEDDAMV